MTDFDISSFKPHRYDRYFEDLRYYIHRASNIYREAPGNKSGLPFHIMTWDLEKFSLYLPDYDFFYNEKDRDEFLGGLTQEDMTGFEEISDFIDITNADGFDIISKEVKLQLESGEKPFYMAFHLKSRTYLDRIYRVYKKIKFQESPIQKIFK